VSAPSSAASISDAERSYLNGTFAELCRIESPSGSERRCADRVLAELRALGVGAEEDDAGRRLGGDSGNLLARVPGGRGAWDSTNAGGADPQAALPGREAAPSLLLCAHLDTVPVLAPVEPVLREGVWENANEAILGADNKAAIAVLLALARRVHQAGAPIDLELLFTVGEERSLAGAREFDVARLGSRFGYVFDHASPIGEVIVASPSHFRFEASFRGAAAHAGLCPEEGRSAVRAAARAIASLPSGRLDEGSTVNVGLISGGSAINVVPERCTFTGEVRGIEESRAEELVAEIVQRCYEAANLPDCDCDVDVGAEKTFTGYRQPPASRGVAVAERALRACGHEPRRVSSGGGSDANALLAGGFSCVNLANGTERAHEPDESVGELALEEMLAVALALLDEAALELGAPV
jgi:tripeptide aminopeptidase